MLQRLYKLRLRKISEDISIICYFCSQIQMTMKRLFYYLFMFVIVGGIVSCDDQSDKNKHDKSSENGIAVLAFEKMDHNFGTITEGEKVIYSFKFANKGNTDLVLTSVGTSCGCTASDYPHKPIKPGKSDKIQVTFNSSNRLGMQHKKVTIRSNTNPEFTVLNIYAQVVDKNTEN